MATSAEVFQANLHGAANSRKLDVAALAAKCGFRGDDRKWLERVWSKGLQRPDPRTEEKLKKLAEVLGLNDPATLWHGDFEPSPYASISNNREWEQLVSDILWKQQLYQHAKLRQGSVVRAVSKAYGHNEALFIADWLAQERGLERMTDADLEMIKETLGDLHDELLYNFQKHGSIVGYVRDRASDHPNWMKFVTEATEGEPCRTDEERQAVVEQKLMETVQNLQHRTLTPPEVYEQFVRIYLEGKDSPINFEFAVVKEILDSLGRHSEWSSYLEIHHGGSQEKAEAHITRMWRQTVELFGPTVTPGTFIGFFERSHLDTSNRDRLDEKSAKASGLSVRLDGSSV